jgi:hypothetical protein
MFIWKNSLAFLSDFYNSSLTHNHWSAFYMPYKIVVWALRFHETTTQTPILDQKNNIFEQSAPYLWKQKRQQVSFGSG